MWKYFAAPAILAMHIWGRLPLALRKRVTPSTWIYPRYKRLPKRAVEGENYS
jgi:hypothetical protein